MLKNKILGLFAISSLALTACGEEESGDDDGATATESNGDTASADDTGGETGNADTGMAEESDGGNECTPDDECVTAADCETGQSCVSCVCTGGDDTGGDGGNPTESDYGPCQAMCAAGEQGIGVAMYEDYCFCSPGCDGMGSMCATPPEGVTAQPQCALQTAMNAPPSQCALICMPGMDDMCPDGAECLELQMGVGICLHPLPGTGGSEDSSGSGTAGTDAGSSGGSGSSTGAGE